MSEQGLELEAFSKFIEILLDVRDTFLERGISR